MVTGDINVNKDGAVSDLLHARMVHKFGERMICKQEISIR